MTTPTQSNNNYINGSQSSGDFYSILDVSVNATQDEIKFKYKELLLLHHPDKQGDPEKFKNIQIAYKILSNPKTRDIYTKSLSSTYDDMTRNYRDSDTGDKINIGYETAENDFTKGSEKQKKELFDLFLQKFEENRPENEKKILASKSNKNYLSNENNFYDDDNILLSFEKLIKNRQEDVIIPQINGMCPHNMNLNIFNMIFDDNKKNHSKDLQQYNQPMPINNSSLRVLDDQSQYSIFGESTNNVNDIMDFNTYTHQKYYDINQFDTQINVTKTREMTNFGTAQDIEKSLSHHMLEREKLMNLDHNDYIIESGDILGSHGIPLPTNQNDTTNSYL